MCFTQLTDLIFSTWWSGYCYFPYFIEKISEAEKMTPLSEKTGCILQSSKLLHYVGLVSFLNNFLWFIYYKWYLLIEFIINDILSLNISHRNIFILLLWKTNDCYNQIRAYYVPVSLHILFPMTTFLKFELLLSPSLLPPPLSHLLSPCPCPLFLLLVHPFYKTE